LRWKVNGKMPAFVIENFGCRATFSDAARIDRQLRESGYERCGAAGTADVIVLNTCTVTAAADAQARDAIRKIHRAYPAAQIVVTGCYAQRAPEELAVLPGVSCVVGNSHQAQIPALLGALSPTGGQPQALNLIAPSEIASARMQTPAPIITGDVFADVPKLSAEIAIDPDRTRPVLKIQDGCNNRCAYCVIPSVRGRSRSLLPEEVIRGINALTADGVKEVVLSGINLGSYGRDLNPRVELQDLISLILDKTGLEQLRFSSIEPMDVTQDFVAMVASSDRIAPHFHIPLQSGSDRVLKRMHRWYRAEHYALHVELIREKLPTAAIGADVIAGFPGETDEDFTETVEFISQLPLTYLHVFSFSVRPGTSAAGLPHQVPQDAIRERARTLRALSTEKATSFRALQAGNKVRVLTLHRGGDHWTEALTGNYLKLRIAGKRAANQWAEVVIGTNADEPLVPIENASQRASGA
jgi:threonylcarbamoyladenosine tRNA methylthiotransferase MtaB